MKKGNSKNLPRRDFILLAALGAYGLNPTIKLLASLLDTDKKSIRDVFNSDYHYFGNNLVNLHFYFINAEIVGETLSKLNRNEPSYMIVKIPQQHISEKLLNTAEFEENYAEGNKRTNSKISGFSFLAFRLFPKAGIAGGKFSLSIAKNENLLDWGNPNYFDLIIPGAVNYKDYKNEKWVDFKNEALVYDDVSIPDKGYIISLYKGMCDQLFDTFPVTILEIPEKLLVTPHSADGSRAIMDSYRIKQDRFVFDRASKNVVRTVEEIWSTQLFFDTVNGKVSPSLRAVGFAPREEALPDNVSFNECPDYIVDYLPTLLDKKTLVYLTSLGRKGKPNKGNEWNIETKGLSFTGLGAIAKLHYKNLSPPLGIDLAEYEHHITLGKDEYIKVARIGVISATGQKALHVQIGQRKIRDGVSYMEFKEYVEIVQKEINYYTDALFIKNEPNTNEPNNYIQARKKDVDGEILHSYDDSYLCTDADDSTKDLWFDRKLWSYGYPSGEVVNGVEKIDSYLPDNWRTHYKRWPFVKVESVTMVTASLNINDPDAFRYADPSCNCTGFFWPVKEVQTDSEKDAYLEFTGTDWNGKTVRFSSTFLFIRKTFIECLSDSSTTIDDLYSKPISGFMHQKFSRRHIRFVDQKIAFTPDYTSSNAPTPNKSNIAKTDYLEYYFSLCRENTGLLLEVVGNKVCASKDSVPITGIHTDTLFNMRVFPLFPQVKRAQIYPENLPESLPALVEYNEDYVNYGFERTTSFTDPKDPKKSITVVYNKGKLVFNQTERFMKDKDNVLELIDGQWQSTKESGYNKIRQAFNGGGAAIGALVNPDFDIQSIGLVKQSISIGRDFNKKHKEATDFVDSITAYNPSDLFRQLPEIFKGIDIVSVLTEEFPALEAPVNEIKNVLGQIEALSTEIKNSAFYTMVRSQLDSINNEIAMYPQLLESYQAQLDDYQNNIKELKDIFDQNYRMGNFENLVKNKIEVYKVPILEFVPEIGFPQIQGTIKDATLWMTEQIFSSFCLQAESVYFYHKIINDSISALRKIRDYNTLENKTFSSTAIAAFNQFLNSIEKHDYIFLDIHQKLPEKILLAKDDYIDTSGTEKNGLLTTIKEKLVTPVLAPYVDFINASIHERAMRLEFQNQTIKQDAYQKAYNEVTSAKDTYKKAVNTFKHIDFADLVNELKRSGNSDDIILVRYFEKELIKLQADVFTVVGSINGFGLPYIIEGYVKASEEFENIKSRLKCSSEEFDKMLQIIENVNNLTKIIKEAAEKAKIYYATNYEELRKDIGQFTLKSKDIVAAYQYVTGDFFWTGLKNSDPKQKMILDLLGITNDIDYKFRDTIIPIIESNLQITTQVKARVAELRQVEAEVQGQLAALRNSLNAVEVKIRDRIKDEAGNIVYVIKQKIGAYKTLMENNPEVEEYKQMYLEGKELYNLMTSISQKEINYTWNTSSFKSADFGIVSFIASNDPKTTLLVNVKSTIYFQPNQFPSVVSKIHSHAENRLSNFGISLLKAVIVNFNEVSFVSATNQKPKFVVKVRDVQFAGAFSFVQALESLFKDLLGDNFTIRINPMNVSIQYLLQIPYVGAPAFGFKDIVFRILYTLHFDSRPMELGVGIGAPENRTKLSVGIYTGLFYFLVVGNPKEGITTIEISIEFGGYFGLSLGPLRGEVKLVVGLYYRKDPTGVIIEGYFLCEGNVRLWFVMITARFYMGVRSQGSYIEGRCTVSYEIRLGRFFKRSFSATYYKKVAGASPGNQQGSQQAYSQRALAKDNLIKGNVAALAPAAQKVAVLRNEVAEMLLSHPVVRKIKPLTFNEWEMFINSYKD